MPKTVKKKSGSEEINKIKRDISQWEEQYRVLHTLFRKYKNFKDIPDTILEEDGLPKDLIDAKSSENTFNNIVDRRARIHLLLGKLRYDLQNKEYVQRELDMDEWLGPHPELIGRSL